MRIIGGTHKNQKIFTPKGMATRPTSGQLREAFFNICQHTIQDARFLDLFAGSGAMGLEALSRGAKASTFVDSSKECIRCLQRNLDAMHFQDNARVIKGDVFHIIEKLMDDKEQFDIIYTDPPYAKKTKWEGKMISYSNRVLKMIDQNTLLKPDGLFFIEDASGVQLDTEDLQSLLFINSRHYGRSLLHRFKEKT